MTGHWASPRSPYTTYSMTLPVTHCVAAVPTYPISKRRHKPPPSFSLRILSKSNQVSDVKTQQSTFYSLDPTRE
ncbi:hypothetical protein DVH24_015756 [Malus domestica]|uniref:Uncharacterized protein n=1 Tax=Malus domestica TaxID=3750 RepID=A0A498HLF8_MALDO|nr:hypothetical protein DVH24_015756 [Malus domestica]